MIINIYVDADATPVKNESIRVAKRYGLKVYLVSNNNDTDEMTQFMQHTVRREPHEHQQRDIEPPHSLRPVTARIKDE